MPLISHRGAAGLAPENSLESISVANRYKPVFIEVDVHRTIDGEFVLYHGDIKQTWSGAPRPETFRQLRARVPHLPTLRQALKHRTKVPLMLDIKCTEAVEELISLLREEEMPSSTAFTSPHPGALYALKRAFPASKTFVSQPYHQGPTGSIELARDYGFSGISLNKWWLNPFVSWLCRRYGKDIMVYTVNHTFWIWFAQTFISMHISRPTTPTATVNAFRNNNSLIALTTFNKFTYRKCGASTFSYGTGDLHRCSASHITGGKDSRHICR